MSTAWLLIRFRGDLTAWSKLLQNFQRIQKMNIRDIVEQVLRDGYLTPLMESEVAKICEKATELSPEEYMALDCLMGALLSGEVVAMPRKQFINVMEELVISEVIAKIVQVQATTDSNLDVGEIAAYALNRLPPLYATTEEGANYQRQKAKEQFEEVIRQQVEAGVNRYLAQPDFSSGKKPLNQNAAAEILHRVSDLLQSSAPEFEN